MNEVIRETTDSIKSNEGLPIRYDVYVPDDATLVDLPTILFLHGFKGFKDWGTFPSICRHLSSSGFGVVAMNFSLNGVGENPLEFDRLDLFARGTLSQDLDDVGTLIAAIDDEKITASGRPLNAKRMGILGHSRGGQTAVAAAAEYPELECLVAWSAVADYNARWSDEMIHDWETEGVTEIKNGRTGQIMPMKKVVYNDARRNAKRVIALNRAKELKLPALFVHSRDDNAVSYENAEQLYKACPSDKKELLLLENTGHTFGGSHPFEDEELPVPLQKALNTSADWLGSHLK